MVTRNIMRIKCDPYKKNIEYKWYNSLRDEYEDIEEMSPLMKEEYLNATIQNRAYEIIEIIDENYNPGNTGLTIYFVGTEDDYNSLCSVISTFYVDSNIECIQDDLYFECASNVMPKIKNKFDEIKEMLGEYSKVQISEPINKYYDTIKPSIAICVMGLYSSGKSTFINSLVGEELLPSGSDPTTARVCKICCGDKYLIKFLFDQHECELTFSGNKYKPSSNFETDIIMKLDEIVKDDGNYNEIFHMNKALEVINKYKGKDHLIGDIIEIQVPFSNTKLPTQEYEFVIYDTPGSNSESNVEHFEVLQTSLDNQTNALPVFLTSPDTMDAEDNDKLLKLIEKIGTSLDTTNTIVVVNKSDEKGDRTLKEKCDKCQDLKIIKWKSTRIFFVSSLIGCASKKQYPDNENQWIDKDLFELYDEKKSKYISDDRRLYEFNIIDKSRKYSVEFTETSSKTDHLYWNSGLAFIEKEIVEYAKKYAMYNKCQQASGYLQQAIEECLKMVKETEMELDNELNEVKSLFDGKKDELCKQLENEKNKIQYYNTEFQKMMDEIYTQYNANNNIIVDEDKLSHIKLSINGVYDKYKEEWKRLGQISKKEKKEKSWIFTQIHIFVDRSHNNLLNEFSGIANKQIEMFWNWKSEEFKKECRMLISNSDALTEEQKEKLDSVVLCKENMSKDKVGFNLRQVGAIRKKHFLMWERSSEKFSAYECYRWQVADFVKNVTYRIHKVEANNGDRFKNWANELIRMLTKELCTFNSELYGYQQKISQLEIELKEKENCKNMLLESKEFIDGLLGIQGE